MTPETHRFADDGAIPNSPLPVLVYHGVEAAADAGSCEALFGANEWGGQWRSQILYEHHFHSTAHEALGIAGGRASVMLGGPSGERFEVRAGDVLVLPAGTGHCRLESSEDLLVVGAYPPGQAWDMRYGDPGEHDEVLANIAAVALPQTDPVLGPDGPLLELWR
ncbi:MAG TPA: cupin domain-containing protein [Solirubrobacteraceae bacterium]|jgi:uncharacterized protein YjlB